jgi:hypothetical protein
MPRLGPVRLIGIRIVLAACVALVCWPAAGSAAQQVITSSGPLTSIFIDDDLACQVQASGDTVPAFFGGTEPGACGTFLALTNDEEIEIEPNPHHVFGPSPPADPTPPNVDYEPITQTIEGAGTETSPRVIETVVDTVEILEETEQKGAELAETDSYVTGQDFYTTTIKMRNLRAATLKGTLYHAGDCFLAGLDTGFGAANVPAAGSAACTIQPGNSPAARFMAFTPTATSGPASRFFESAFTNVWGDVNAEASQFPDTADANTEQDNGMGLSWPIELLRGGTAEVSFTTTISPSSAPTSSTTAGACVNNGQVPVTISAVNGAKTVDYVLDGVPGSAPASLAGQATISVPAGQHTLEYWGEDLTGTQESSHHVITFLAAPGGPGLTITSDQKANSYEVGEKASVTIAATGPGIASNPSAAHVAISTAKPGKFAVTRSAASACGTTTATFSYTVIPQPVLGKTVNLNLVSGKVFVALPSNGHASLAAPLHNAIESLSKGLKFIPLTQARQVPVGSILKTTAGVARITTATATKNKLQFGNFGAGIFKLLQNRRQRGLTELDLIDNQSSRHVCASVGKRAVAAKHLSGKVLGRLTGSAHGRFTTRGQFSAATVRGTIWGIRNRCDGTLTRVTRGVVQVRDFVRRKTVTVFTGQSYLARAP